MSMYEAYHQEWVRKKQSNKHFSHQYLEKPAIFKILKKINLNSKKIVCLGCGEGGECQEILDLGAKSVLGIDNSKGLIEKAKYSYPKVEFLYQDLQKFNLLENSVDIFFSSLALHYLPDWPKFFRQAYKFGAKGSEFIFSTHHPIKWGAKITRNKDFNQFLLGYKKSKQSQNYEIYGDYLNFYQKQDTLFGKLKINYYHRSFSQMFTDITSSGWQILEVVEPQPTPESKSTKPDFYEVYSKIPLFVIFRLKKV